jgi:acetolactate synthase-1/2/3 large subunit
LRALSAVPCVAGTPDPVGLEVARRALSESRCPVLIVGVGAVATSSVGRGATVAAVRHLVQQAAIPVLTTYKARGVVGDDSPCAAGLATGATIESDLLHEADLIVGVGLDPVELIPGPWPYRAPVVLLGPWAIDDSRYFGLRLLVEVVGELAPMLDTLAVDLTSHRHRGAGAEYRQRTRRRLLEAVPPSPAGLTPQQVVTVARRVAPSGTIATVDAGAHMLVAMPLWEVEQPGELLISSGLATMGFALPAAIAAALVHPGRHVVCFTGDGGLAMAMAELETVARLRLPVVVVVFNDATLSLIAIKQRAEGHGGADAVRYAPIDFAAIGAGCGLPAERVGDAGTYERVLAAALERDGPTLLDVTVDPSGYRAVMEVIRGAPTTTAHRGQSSLD